MRILVVDDSQTWRTQAHSWLTEVGHTVLEAEDGAEALALVQQERELELVLFDVNMPKLDGVSFLRIARSLPHMKDTIMVALTSIATERIILELESNGASCVLSKPTGRYELLGQLELSMDGSSPQSPQPPSVHGIPQPTFGIAATYHAALSQAIARTWMRFFGEEAVPLYHFDSTKDSENYFKLEVPMGSDQLQLFIPVHHAQEMLADSQEAPISPSQESPQLFDFLKELANNTGGLLIRTLEGRGIHRDLGLPTASIVQLRAPAEIEIEFSYGSGEFFAGVRRKELAA